MRILHTSDWHLGRTFHGTSLAAEQAAMLGALVDVVRAEGVDVVVVAGDLYDRQLPPGEAVTLLSAGLRELRGAGAQVIAIPGNHDSPRRLGFGSELLSLAGVHLFTDVREVGRPVLLPDGGAGVAFYPVPYLEPELARHALDAPEVRSHEGLLRVALDRCRADLGVRGRVRSVAIAHAFVSGGQACDSERVLSVGGADRVGVASLEGFDYVALGHLHGRQRLGKGQVRYAGSPLAYSFSEREHRKGVWVIDLPASGPARVDGVDLPAGRPLAALCGPLEQLLTDPGLASAEASWVQATLTDPVLPRDSMTRLRVRFPHAVRLDHQPPVQPGAGPSYRERTRDLDDLSLVESFVSHVTGQALSPAERHECTAAIDDVARGAA